MRGRRVRVAVSRRRLSPPLLQLPGCQRCPDNGLSLCSRQGHRNRPARPNQRVRVTSSLMRHVSAAGANFRRRFGSPARAALVAALPTVSYLVTYSADDVLRYQLQSDQVLMTASFFPKLARSLLQLSDICQSEPACPVLCTLEPPTSHRYAPYFYVCRTHSGP